jgi:hypothetical protein
VATNADKFLKDKYVIHRNAISKDMARLGAQYAIFSALQDNQESRDSQVPGAISKYADPFMESLLISLLPTVEESTGLSLSPTYSYYRLYKPGDELKPHTDRPACEISLTINLGYFYNTDDKDYRWNIFIDGNEAVTEPGDMVIYRGLEMEHWRTPFAASQGSWQVQAFLHYVDVNGPYSMCSFDGRPMLGFPQQYRNENLDILAHRVHSERVNKQEYKDAIFYVTNK